MNSHIRAAVEGDESAACPGGDSGGLQEYGAGAGACSISWSLVQT
jgi:hypothetical protein